MQLDNTKANNTKNKPVKYFYASFASNQSQAQSMTPKGNVINVKTIDNTTVAHMGNTKPIEVKKNDKLNQCESSKMSSSQIKKIIIENYTTETEDNKPKAQLQSIHSKPKHHHHSLSGFNDSPKHKSPYQKYSSSNKANANANANLIHINPNPTTNTITNHMLIRSTDFSSKYYDDSKYRAKSLSMTTKLNRNAEYKHKDKSNGNTLKNSINSNNKDNRDNNYRASHYCHHQWDTLSSRMKANSQSRSKESLSSASNYYIDSTISKKLFKEANANANTNAKAKDHKCSLKQLNDPINFNRTIQLERTSYKAPVTKPMPMPMPLMHKITKPFLFSKTFTALANSTKPSFNTNDINTSQLMKKSYTKTDSFKSSFREIKDKKPPTYYSVLSMHILSNWGNSDKVGITEIQLYDDKDKRIPVNKCHVFNGNEDNIGRVINNKTQTINDNDMWTSPLVPNLKLELYIGDSDSNRIASVLIWNYNGKDLSKGIKEIELNRKNSLCWKGIVPKGAFKPRIDYSYKITLNQAQDLSQSKPNQSARNRNGNGTSQSNGSAPMNFLLNSNSTSIGKSFNDLLLPYKTNKTHITFNRLKIVFKENYGHKEYIGITGLRLIDKDGSGFGVETASSVGAMPKDISSVYANDSDDPHIFENVFNNINETIDETNMWLTVLEPVPYMEIGYETQQTLSGMRLYNYNEPHSLDKGAKVIEVIIDDDYCHSTTVLLMKGIGSALGDYSQLIPFPYIQMPIDAIDSRGTDIQYEHMRFGIWNAYVSPLLPYGHWFKFAFISNHGDLSFIGLNAIEFFDCKGMLIIPNRIINDPEMRLVKGHHKDINNYWMIDYYDVNKVHDDGNEANESNEVIFIFDKVVCVSYIRLYNLVRNVKQGVKAFQVFCDDCIVFEGEMGMAIRDRGDIKNQWDILFIDNEEIKSLNVIGEHQGLGKGKEYKETVIEGGYKLTLDT